MKNIIKSNTSIIIEKGSDCLDCEEKIKNIINSVDKETLTSIFSKKDLNNMYNTIFSSKPRSKMKKEDIAYSIWHYFHSMDRAAAFASLM